MSSGADRSPAGRDEGGLFRRVLGLFPRLWANWIALLGKPHFRRLKWAATGAIPAVLTYAKDWICCMDFGGHYSP